MNREERLLCNFKEVERSLSVACKKVGRNPNEVTLLAVTKYAADSDVLFFLKQGLIKHIGESRLQQAVKRWTSPQFSGFNVVKHLIGHLQQNKAAKAAQFFDFIDSLDNLTTAEILDKHVPDGKKLQVLVQVKLTKRETQSGLPLEKARELVRQLRGLQHLNVCGYMAIAPQGASETELRVLFAPLKKAFDEDFPKGQERLLSLGMSEDFVVAVEEGSTLPRIGSKLFA